MNKLTSLTVVALLLAMYPLNAAAQPKKLKIFILSGQSNMQGMANATTLPAMAADPLSEMLDLNE